MKRIILALLIVAASFAGYAQVNHALEPAGARVSAATTFAEGFGGNPAAPQRFAAPRWDIMAHKRDENGSSLGPQGGMDGMEAHHGADCDPHPATHSIDALADAAFICRDHLMTAINGGDYAALVFTPDHLVDFSAGEAVIRMDISTLRISQRDWWDVWITPWDEAVPMPLRDPFLPDGYGIPRDGVVFDLGDQNTLGAAIVRNGGSLERHDGRWAEGGYDRFLAQSATRRDTVEIRISRTRIAIGMPAYNFFWVDQAISPLSWSRGVVQFGHHSYTPTKAGSGPNTWHWDNVSISPAVPFAILHTNEDPGRYITDGTVLTFDRPAPANALARFHLKGQNPTVSFNGGASWVTPTRLAFNNELKAYKVAVPAGATTMRIRATPNQYATSWWARNVSVMALDAPAAPAPPAATPTPTTPPAIPPAIPPATPPPGTGPIATTWYFAEGYTGEGFDEYLTILNPNAASAIVDITYYLSSGGPVVKRVNVAGNTRATVTVHDPALGVGRGQEVSAKVVSTNGVGVVAERPMYFTYGAGLTGGHSVVGATAPATTWLFGEGYTGEGFDQYLAIVNPNGSPAPVTITYFLAGGGPVTKSLTVPANARATVTVHEPLLGIGRGQQVSARVTTSNAGGVVVERSMYFDYGGGVNGGHAALGATTPRPAWYFAEGYTEVGFDEYLTILNPNPAQATVTITYFQAGAAPTAKQVTVAGNARRTVTVHDAAEGVGRGRMVSAKVETSATGGIVVERPIYFTYGGSITGGHVVVGAAGPRPMWLFAEGFTGVGFDEYLTMLNPSGSPASVRLTYYLTNGTTQTRNLSIPATSRVTVTVHDPALGVGRGQEVAAKVESTNGVGIIAERPMYFTYGAGVSGGHAAMGYAP